MKKFEKSTNHENEASTWIAWCKNLLSSATCNWWESWKLKAAFTADKAIKWIYDRHLFIVIINSSGGDSPASYWDENYAQPYFDNTTRRDLTITIGQTAMLHCRVRNLGDRAVSFIGLLSIRGGERRLYREEPLMIIGLKFIN